MNDSKLTEESIVRAMEVAVHEWLNEHHPVYGQGYHPPLPDGLRLEMHPSVMYALRRVSVPNYLDNWKPPYEVPVKVTTDLPTGMWRLVTVTENVHLGGKI